MPSYIDPSKLTLLEGRILKVIKRARGAVRTKEDIINTAWGEAGWDVYITTLTVHIARIRKKIGARRIETISGVGYRYRERA